jgi:hypothetical protein
MTYRLWKATPGATPKVFKKIYSRKIIEFYINVACRKGNRCHGFI